MDPEPNLIKVINLLKKRGFKKEANILEEFLTAESPRSSSLITECPICGSEPEPECVLCDGTGEMVSIVDEDMEDMRVKKELKFD